METLEDIKERVLYEYHTLFGRDKIGVEDFITRIITETALDCAESHYKGKELEFYGEAIWRLTPYYTEKLEIKHLPNNQNYLLDEENN